MVLAVFVTAVLEAPGVYLCVTHQGGPVVWNLVVGLGVLGIWVPELGTNKKHANAEDEPREP